MLLGTDYKELCHEQFPTCGSCERIYQVNAMAAAASVDIAATAATASKLPGLGEALPCVQQTGCCYLEYNGTTPIFPEVAREMQPFLSSVGNPSSGHAYGRRRKAALELTDAAVERIQGLLHKRNTVGFWAGGCGLWYL